MAFIHIITRGLIKSSNKNTTMLFSFCFVSCTKTDQQFNCLLNNNKNRTKISFYSLHTTSKRRSRQKSCIDRRHKHNTLEIVAFTTTITVNNTCNKRQKCNNESFNPIIPWPPIEQFQQPSVILQSGVQNANKNSSFIELK